MFTGRKAKARVIEETGGSVTHLQKTFIWFVRIKGMKVEELTKRVPVVVIIQHETGAICLLTHRCQLELRRTGIHTLALFILE